MIPSRIELAELNRFTIDQKPELEQLLTGAIKQGLEGLVIKDKLSTYDPNQRHWNKIKKVSSHVSPFNSFH